MLKADPIAPGLRSSGSRGKTGMEAVKCGHGLAVPH